MNPSYPFVAQRAGHRCEYCRAPEAVFNFPFEVEHIIPTIKRGSNRESNWALACRACNVRKADHLNGLDEVTGGPAPLFNPRQDHWQEHFYADRETGAIQGKTPTGRATVARLEMNNSAQLEARQQWMRLGLFP